MDTTRIGRRGRALTLTAACLALFVIFLDNTIVNVALPSIERDLSATPDALEWVVSGYVVAFAGLVLLGGTLGDRYGRRRLFIAGLLLFAAASAVGALASTAALLTAARAGQGVGAALLAPLSLSLLAQAFPRDKLPAAIGVWAGVSGLGLAIGPLVGGLLVEHTGWHAVFWVNVPIAAAAAIAAAGATESRNTARAAIDVPGAALATAGLVGTVAGLTRAVRHPWTDPTVLALLVVGALLLVGFAARQRTASAPLIPTQTLHDRRFGAAAAVVALASFTLLGSIWFLTLYLQNIAGYSAVAAGVRTLPLTVTTLIVAPIAGKIATRRGPVPVLVVGLVVTGAAFAALARVNTGTGYGYLVAAPLALGAGLALVLPTAVAVMLAGVAPDRVGVAAGLATMSRQAGGALGLAVLATVGGRLAVTNFHQLLSAPPELDDLVSGGRVQLIGQLAGQSARDAATAGFLHGFSTVMEAASAVTLLALAAALRTGGDHHMSRPSDVAASHPTTATPTDAVPAR